MLRVSSCCAITSSAASNSELDASKKIQKMKKCWQTELLTAIPIKMVQRFCKHLIINHENHFEKYL